MKKIFYLAISFLLLIGCQSEYETYHGEAAAYLVSYTGYNSDTTNISFTYINQDSTYVPVTMQIKTIGKTTNYRREVKLIVKSDNCVEGVDYSPIESTQYIEAGSFIKSFEVRLLRTPDLLRERKQIDIEIVESKDFKMLHKEYYNSMDTLCALKHTIAFSELMNEAPKTWGVQFGTFSALKFVTICNEMNIPREKFLDAVYMSVGRKNYIKAEMNKILKAAKEAGNPFYEADGVTEMTMG